MASRNSQLIKKNTGKVHFFLPLVMGVLCGGEQEGGRAEERDGESGLLLEKVSVLIDLDEVDSLTCRGHDFPSK